MDKKEEDIVSLLNSQSDFIPPAEMEHIVMQSIQQQSVRSKSVFSLQQIFVYSTLACLLVVVSLSSIYFPYYFPWLEELKSALFLGLVVYVVYQALPVLSAYIDRNFSIS